MDHFARGVQGLMIIMMVMARTGSFLRGQQGRGVASISVIHS